MRRRSPASCSLFGTTLWRRDHISTSPLADKLSGTVAKQNQSGNNFSRRSTATCPLIAIADAEGTWWCGSISPRKPSRCAPHIRLSIDRGSLQPPSRSIFSFTRRTRLRLPDTCSNSQRRFTSVAGLTSLQLPAATSRHTHRSLKLWINRAQAWWTRTCERRTSPSRAR